LLPRQPQLVKMTTIIMISNDSSVIFNSGGSKKSQQQQHKYEMSSSSTCSSEKLFQSCDNISNETTLCEMSSSSDHSSTNTPKRRHSAPASPDNSLQHTPDSSFVTPKPLTKNVRRGYKNSVSTHESDSEELNHSSSSAASTISGSRIDSLVPVFLTSFEDFGGQSAKEDVIVTSTPRKPKGSHDIIKEEQEGAEAKNSSKNTFSSPINGPHGLKFFVNPVSGQMDVKPGSEEFDTRSLERQRQQQQEMKDKKFSAINTVGLPTVPNYCTLTNRRKVIHVKDERSKTQSLDRTSASFSIYSDINDLKDLLKATKAEQRRKSRPREPILWEFQDSEEECMDTGDAIEDEIYGDANSLVKAILPTGCHRHPKHVSLPPVSKDSLIDEKEDFFLNSLLHDEEPIKATHSLANLWSKPSLEDASYSLDLRANRAKKSMTTSLEGLLDSSSAKSTSKNSSVTSSDLKARRFSSRLSGLNLAAGSKILRRHTTYVKSSSLSKPKVHVHSWHAREKRLPKKAAGGILSKVRRIEAVFTFAMKELRCQFPSIKFEERAPSFIQ
jgi:hypothetical protein